MRLEKGFVKTYGTQQKRQAKIPMASAMEALRNVRQSRKWHRYFILTSMTSDFTNGSANRNHDWYDHEGYDRYGFDREGYDRNGFDREGIHRNGTLYWEGYDWEGYDAEGFDREGKKRETDGETNPEDDSEG